MPDRYCHVAPSVNFVDTSLASEGGKNYLPGVTLGPFACEGAVGNADWGSERAVTQ